MKVDAIVNAANTYLSHGGGLAKAIAIKGGKKIIKQSKKWIEEFGSVETGKIAITSAGNL